MDTEVVLEPLLGLLLGEASSVSPPVVVASLVIIKSPQFSSLPPSSFGGLVAFWIILAAIANVARMGRSMCTDTYRDVSVMIVVKTIQYFTV